MADGRAGTGRLSLLLDHFDLAGESAELRLTGLGDDECRCEPVPGCWSVRRRAEAVTPEAYGPGQRVLGAPDISNSEYAGVVQDVAGGSSVENVAADWHVSVERIR